MTTRESCSNYGGASRGASMIRTSKQVLVKACGWNCGRWWVHLNTFYTFEFSLPVDLHKGSLEAQQNLHD